GRNRARARHLPGHNRAASGKDARGEYRGQRDGLHVDAPGRSPHCPTPTCFRFSRLDLHSSPLARGQRLISRRRSTLSRTREFWSCAVSDVARGDGFQHYPLPLLPSSVSLWFVPRDAMAPQIQKARENLLLPLARFL